MLPLLILSIYEHFAAAKQINKKPTIHTDDQQKTRTKNNNNTSTIEFYTSRGHSIESAEKFLSERQTTFSLEKCIKKYGEQEGFIVWQERQNKWQNTLNSKSDAEKSELNSKRSILGFHSLWCDEIDMPGYFYVIQVENKVKITEAPKTHRDGSRGFYCLDTVGHLLELIYHPPISRTISSTHILEISD